MRIKGKTFLIGLIATVFSVTGVFSAWVFNGDYEIDAGIQNMDVGVDPIEEWMFGETVTVTFNAEAWQTNEYKAVLANGQSEATFVIPKGTSIPYEKYIAEVGSVPRLVNDNGEVCQDYVFASWYDFDISTAFDYDTYIYSQYVDTTRNPVIYKSTNLNEPVCGLVFDNEGPEDAHCYFSTFFIVDEQTKGNDYFVIKYDGEIYDTRSIVNDYRGVDFVDPGYYFVLFDAESSSYNSQNYEPFGGNCRFDRIYDWHIFGNPNNGWTKRDRTPRFGYTYGHRNNALIWDVTYSSYGVRFSDSYGDYKFKIVEPTYDISSHTGSGESTKYPQISLTPNAMNYVYIEDDYLVLDSSIVERKFDITIDVYYEEFGMVNGIYEPFNYPLTIELDMTPTL